MSEQTSGTGGAGFTAHFEDGEQVYPCRCGQVHRGDYAFHDWNHHECFHNHELVALGSSGTDKLQTVCPECGEVFVVDLSTRVD